MRDIIHTDPDRSSRRASPFTTIRNISVERAKKQIERIISLKNRVLGNDTSMPSILPLDFDKVFPSDVTIRSLDAAIRKTQDYFLSTQDRMNGHWHGELDDNITLTSELIFFYKILNIDRSDIIAKCLHHIEQTQNPDGSWSLYYGGPGELSATIEAYVACCLAGVSQDQLWMQNAATFIRANGGIQKARVFTKINLAFFGFYRWENIPIIPAELMLIPKRLPFNILEFSSWSRAVIIPLTIIFHHKPNFHDRCSFSLDHLMEASPDYVDRPAPRNIKRISIDYAFFLANHYMALFEKYRFIKPLRKYSLKRVEKWIVEHQNESGDWCGIIPAMMNSVVGLHLLGYPMDNDMILKGIQSVERFLRFEDDRAILQSTVSPIWDTAITGVALHESGYPLENPTLIKAAKWLLSKEITQPGDWAHKAKSEPGAWAFEFNNTFYPDTDDTALVLQFLLQIRRHHKDAAYSNGLNDAIQRGLRWLEAMQCKNGGYGAFDKDNNQWFINEIPFADLKSLLDPSTPDVTGHILEAFGIANYGLTHPTVKKIIDYLKESQEPEGSWYGRWGVNYIYGTSGVLVGLKAVGENMQLPYVQRALRWLFSCQNPDGGWGESCQSYDDRNLMGKGRSTASQTAWALLGLLAADLHQHPSVLKGVTFLIDRQEKDGTWAEPEYTGTGFPRHFYLRYDLYRIYFPLLALGRYRQNSQPI